jgi:SAM-dependent methyltransferase
MDRPDERAVKSHVAHEQHMISLIHEKDKRLFTLKNKDCIAYLLNIRTLDILKPLFYSKNTWLTIGDYNGFEARYLKEQNQPVIASDISDAFLKEAKAEGLIDEFRKENVEHLSLEQNSIDFLLCREAFHHFPRAYLGAYEMIRVAKKGVIIIEPLDILAKMPLVLLFKNICDRFNPQLINKFWKNRYSWEPVGNYVFKISEREVEKIAMGIGLPCIAFLGINIIKSDNEKIMTVPTDQKLWHKMKSRIKFLNLLSRLRITPYNMLCSVIFKEMPDEETIEKLKTVGYTVIKLPSNPYLK